jgi:hypothetical protein
MRKLIPFFLLAISSRAIAQVQLPQPSNIQKAITKGTRTTTGSPGKNYWQNKANYKIDAQFDPKTRMLEGNETIVYENNSRDTLRQIIFKLYPNIYKKGAPRLTEVASADLHNGVQISEMKAGGKVLDNGDYRITSTNMGVKISPLLPGGSLTFNIRYNYRLNETSHIRTGEIDSGAFFIAYFFPRIAVYDDVDGWNLNPYLGTQEFYNDFCDFDLAITVPARYIVWATGDLVNRNDIFNQQYIDRMNKAEKEDGFINIIDSTDLLKGGITKGLLANTWKYSSRNVTDAVFAISDHYTWQSTSAEVDHLTKRRTRVDAVFNSAHKDYYNVVSDARKTVVAMSDRFPKWPFPYNHETVFDGLDQMEYPMMVNDNPVEDRAESIELTDHEIFHTMFPFYMGINETKYGWMDEGWATIGEWLISSIIDSTLVDEYGVAPYERAAGSEIDLPISTLTTQEFGSSMFLNSYPKPAMGYLYVKDLLGDELFFKALHTYIRNWNGKHPTPADFFNSINAGAGKNLDWFWKRWFFDGGIPDLGIGKFSASKSQKAVAIELKGSKPLPIDLTVLYKDGSSEKFHRNVGVWEKDNKVVNVLWTSPKMVDKITLGSTYVPDVNHADNIYIAH